LHTRTPSHTLTHP
jgi:hypothetical protein